MKKLKGLKLEDYQHESDKAAFLSLEKVKAFDKAVDWVIKNTIEEIDKAIKMINDNIDMTYIGVYEDGTVVTKIRNLDLVQKALELAILKGTGKC